MAHHNLEYVYMYGPRLEPVSSAYSKCGPLDPKQTVIYAYELTH